MEEYLAFEENDRRLSPKPREENAERRSLRRGVFARQSVARHKKQNVGKEKMMEEKQLDAASLPVLTLAYLGDAVYELRVREHFMKKGICRVAELHKRVIPLVSAAGQSALWEKLEPQLSEEDRAVMMRGRNAKSPHSRPSVPIAEYRRATGLETLIGHWYLQNEQQKLDSLFALLFEEEE